MLDGTVRWWNGRHLRKVIPLNWTEVLAQTTQTATTTPAGPPPPEWMQFLASPMFMLLLMVGLFYFFIVGGKRKEERKRQDMLNQLAKGTRVQTIGGILGTVVEAREQEVILKVDETTNTKIKFSRSAIHRVLDDDKAESK